jgi:hypothetical protein
MGFFDSFNNSLDKDNHSSPFGEAGLLFDPLAYVGDAVGKGDDYRNFMRKTWEIPNKELSPYAKKFHEFERKNPWINPLQSEIDKTSFGSKIKDYSEDKPGDAALAIMGSVFGGGALLGGMGGGGAGGGASGGFGTGAQEAMHLGTTGGGGWQAGGGLGVFGNGGQAGMSGVGTGNAGQLFGSTGINTGGVGGVGGTGAGGFMEQAGGAQGLMQLGQQMPGMQQQPQQEQQQQGPKPYWYRGQVVWM